MVYEPIFPASLTSSNVQLDSSNLRKASALPKSTLMLLVSAFSGIDKIQSIYQSAIENDYRFFSYGDVSLLYRNE